MATRISLFGKLGVSHKESQGRTPRSKKIEENKLYGKEIGYIDVHILASSIMGADGKRIEEKFGVDSQWGLGFCR